MTVPAKRISSEPVVTRRVRGSAAPAPVAAASAREPYELRPRAKAVIVVTIPQTPYNLRPRVTIV